MPTGTAAVGIICKTPKAGASKTRLFPLLRPDAAADLAGCCLMDTVATIDSLPGHIGHRGYAVYAPEGSEAELARYIPQHFGLLCRKDATLGTVLFSATEHLLAAGHDVAVLVNADSPTLPVLLLQHAIETARRPGDRVVLGPAIDGGYYLIALKRAHAHLFERIPWSTAEVLASTQERAREINLTAELLPPWYDIDDPSSVHMLTDELRGTRPPFATDAYAPPAAKMTRHFVQSHPELTTTLTRTLQSSAV